MAIISISGHIGSGKDTVGKIIQYLVATSKHNHNMTFYEYQDIFLDSDKWSEWKIKKFAFKLKQVASILTGIPIEKFEDQEFKATYLSSDWDIVKQVSENEENGSSMDDGYSTTSMTVREFLQKLGTEAVRNGLHVDTWCNALMAEYQVLDDTLRSSMGNIIDYSACEFPSWIITDTRFPNEFDAIKERRGLCIRLVRPGEKDCNICGKTVREQKKGCNEPACYRQFLKTPKHASETALDGFTFDYVLNNSGTMDDLVEEVRKMLVHFKII